MDTLCICRACLSSTSQEYIELGSILSDDMTYLECFNACTLLTAKSGDKLPTMLCNKCAKNLEKAYAFIIEARAADDILRSQENEKIQILSTKSDTIQDAYIENMEIVVIKSIEESVMGTTTEMEENVDKESYIIDSHSRCSKNDADGKLDIPKNEWTGTRRLFDSHICSEDHMILHKELQNFKCLQCSKCFRTQSSLERHSNLRHKAICCQVIQEVQDTKVHLNDEMLLSRIHCKEGFASKESLKLYERTHHNFASNYPQELNENTSSEHSIDEKLHDEFVDLIEHCETENSDVDEIRLEHADKVSTLKECSICKRKLLERNMEKHLKLHATKEDNFLCAYCPRNFKNQKSLRQHEKTHFEQSEDIVSVCTACDRQFATVTLLDQHRKNTHKEREHICTICGNAFKLRNQLNNHMKLHLEKNIECPHCGKKYARQFDLNVHLRRHTGEMPFSCHLCEKRFAIKVHLTYHLQKHYGIKHTCKECGAQFNSKQKLKAHSFKHTGMPYRCEICDHGFPNRDVFKRHLFRVHQAMISEEALLEMFQRNTGKSTRIREVSVSLDREVELHEVSKSKVQTEK